MIFINHIEILGGEAAIVEIQGPLNSETSPDFEEYINRLVDKKIFYILLDAAKLEFISSDGIGLTLFIQKKLSKNNGYFVIYNLPDEIYSLFKLLGFDKIFTIALTRIDAMQIMDRQIEMRGSPEKAAEEGLQPHSGNEAAVKDGNDTDDGAMGFYSSGIINSGAEMHPAEINRDRDEFDPVIVECINCSSLIRVKKSGEYICPSCKVEFTVDREKSVRFL